jgi:hypothetical protein
MGTFDIPQTLRRPFRAVVQCPVDTCTWETDADPCAGQPVKYVIDTNGPGDLSDAVSRAVDKVAIERASVLEATLRQHFESHDVLDWIRTIRTLEQLLAQHDCGVRPHMPTFWQDTTAFDAGRQ